MDRLNQKKGQGGLEISILVILIALFILVYVILLPPSDRSQLLNETSAAEDGVEVPASATVLVSEIPGKVFTYSKNVQTIKLEPMHLFSKETTETSALVNALAVSRNLLKDNFKNVIFSLEDIDRLQELKLFMLVQDSKGRLTIKFNGNVVYQGMLTGEQMPITLPKEYARSSNKLEFSVDAPGASGIFSSNYYILQDVSLIKVYEKQQTASSRTFFADTAEGVKVKKAELHYVATCNQLEPRGTLTIKLNNRLASKDTVFCEYTEEITLPLSTDELSADGRNKLDFSIDKGDYNFDQLRVVTELAQSTYPKYAFDIDSSLYSDVKDGKKKILLKMAFGDGSRKKAVVYIQDKQFTFDTSAKSYSKDISLMVDNGANFVKIVPKENFEITSLKVIAQAA